MATSSLSLETETLMISKVLNDVEISLKSSKVNSLRFREKLRSFELTKSNLQTKLESLLDTKTMIRVNIENLFNDMQRCKHLLSNSQSVKCDIVQSASKIMKIFETVEKLEKASQESELKFEARKFKLNEVSFSEAKEEAEWLNQRRMLRDQNEKHEQTWKLEQETTSGNWQKFLSEIDRLENEAQGIIDVAAQVVKGLAE